MRHEYEHSHPHVVFSGSGWSDNAIRRSQCCFAQRLRRGLQTAGSDWHGCNNAHHGSGACCRHVRDVHEAGGHVQSCPHRCQATTPGISNTSDKETSGFHVDQLSRHFRNSCPIDPFPLTLIQFHVYFSRLYLIVFSQYSSRRCMSECQILSQTAVHRHTLLDTSHLGSLLTSDGF